MYCTLIKFLFQLIINLLLFFLDFLKSNYLDIRLFGLVIVLINSDNWSPIVFNIINIINVSSEFNAGNILYWHRFTT